MRHQDPSSSSCSSLIHAPTQEMLHLPFEVSLIQLYHILAGKSPKGHYRSKANGMALLDWVQVRLVEQLRQHVNAIMAQGQMVPFPVDSNAMTWPELARQLLVVHRIQNLMQLR